MTEKAFVKDGYCQALDKARCGNWDNNRSWKRHTARKNRECVYVLSAVYMTAENLLRIFPKGSELKKNTNFTLAYDDLTGLDRSFQSQSRMTEHSLFEPFRQLGHLFCFVFFFLLLYG